MTSRQRSKSKCTTSDGPQRQRRPNSQSSRRRHKPTEPQHPPPGRRRKPKASEREHRRFSETHQTRETPKFESDNFDLRSSGEITTEAPPSDDRGWDMLLARKAKVHRWPLSPSLWLSPPCLASS